MKDREEIAERLAACGYIADSELATAISLKQRLRRPLLLEGEAGVGKTEVAKALASIHATELIRLQCYEGLDQSSALYEWNYQRQLLAIRTRSRIRSSRRNIFWNGRCWPRSAAPSRRCCWSMKSIAPTTSSRRSCSNSCPTSRSRFPSSAPSRLSRFRMWC